MFRRLPGVGAFLGIWLATLIAAPGALAQGSYNFTAAGPLTILDGTASQPYPLTLNVSGVPGVMSRVTVTLLGLSHTFPDDLDILLVGPGGQKVMLMSDAGGGFDVTNLNVRFDENAPAVVPDNGFLGTGSVTNRPADYEPGDAMAAPAPAGPYGSSLNALIGASPLGTWSLYVMDDRGDDVGQMLNGWRLDVTTINSGTATDLGVSMTDTPDPVTAGAPLTWSVRITNAGPLAATSLRLTNVLPATVTFQSATSAQGTCIHSAGTVSCNFASLGVGAVATATITATPFLAGSITNTARISGAQPDIVPGNNTAVSATTVTPGTTADLVMQLTDRPDPVVLGSNIIYAVAITNLGPLTATSTVVSNLLPSSVALVAATTSKGSCTSVGNRVLCQLGSLTNTEQALVTIVARTVAAGQITNTVRVFSSVPDLTPASGTVVTRVDEQADLAVALVEPFDPVAIGNPVTYTILVTNLGVNTARQVSVVETLPAGIAFRSAIPSQGTCQNLNGILVCNLGTLSNGASASILVDFQPLSIQTLVSAITVSSPVPDPNPGNNQINESTTTFPIATGNPMGTGLQIVATNDASVLAGALTSAGLTGLRVTSSRLDSLATTNLSTAGLYFVGTTNSTYGLSRGGIVFSTGNVRVYQTGPNNSMMTSTAFGRAANLEQEDLLTPITGFGVADFNHFDATLFEVKFDMLPGYDRVEFQVVFGSEEFPEVAVPFLDGFGIYLNGTNIAFAGGQPINVLHPDMATLPGVTTELDGVLAPGGNPILTFSAPVPAGSSNNVLTFVLADTSDATIDTTVFISSFEGAQSPNADLKVAITSAPNAVIVGSNLTYTVGVQNLGPYTSTNVIVATLIPAGTTFLNASASQGTGCVNNATLINCYLGNLARSATAAVTVVVRPVAPGLLTNAALVVSTNVADFSDGNNYAETVTTVIRYGTFAALGPLPILDAAPSLPYPSVIQVSGLTGVVSRVSVRLEDLTHSYPADLDILLADPSGRRVMLMSDAGLDFPVEGVTLTIGDDGFDALPQFEPLTSGTYSPTDYEPGDPFLGFPEGFAYGNSLSQLTGRNPNGAWSLYIMDDRGVDTGVLAQGWRLILETGPLPARPTLRIQRVGAQLVLSWNVEPNASFYPESTPVMGPGAVWTPVTEPPIPDGFGRMTVTLPLSTAGNSFYRLRL